MSPTRKDCEKCGARIDDPQLADDEPEICDDCAFDANDDDLPDDPDDGPWAGPGERTLNEGGY